MKQIKIIARIALKDSGEPKRKKCTYFDFHLNNLHAVYRSICKSSFRRAELTAVVLFFLISFLALVCHFIAVFSPHSLRSCGYKKHARRPLGHNFDCLIIYALLFCNILHCDAISNNHKLEHDITADWFNAMTNR